jgi:pimeloyl-ACP methyl ester carboxylesterase
MHLVCAGEGSPTVILVHGLGGSTKDWTSVLNQADDSVHVCAVDRIGAGLSSPATEDRTTSAIVDDLHMLLAVVGIEAPVILVGHSIAGLDLRLHAGRYPEDVAGMVFVDPSTVGQMTAQLKALPPADPDEPEAVRARREELEQGWPAPQSVAERYDVTASEPQVATVTSFGDIPVIVLSAGLADSTLPEPVRSDLHTNWYALHDSLAAMSTRGRREVVPDAGHSIQIDDPEAVVRAINELVQASRP